MIPEFDVPAHASIWGKGYPELVISCADGQTLLNPTDDGGVYEVISGLLAEFQPLFYTADVIHFGGDEVEDLTCWNESSAVQEFMAAKGLPDVNAVRNYFESKVQAIAKTHNADSMFWEEGRWRGRKGGGEEGWRGARSAIMPERCALPQSLTRTTRRLSPLLSTCGCRMTRCKPLSLRATALSSRSACTSTSRTLMAPNTISGETRPFVWDAQLLPPLRSPQAL